jgi:hypothetical protein
MCYISWIVRLNLMVQKPIVNKVIGKGSLVGKTFVALMGLGNGVFPCLDSARDTQAPHEAECGSLQIRIAKRTKQWTLDSSNDFSEEHSFYRPHIFEDDYNASCTYSSYKSIEQSAKWMKLYEQSDFMRYLLQRPAKAELKVVVWCEWDQGHRSILASFAVSLASRKWKET